MTGGNRVTERRPDVAQRRAKRDFLTCNKLTGGFSSACKFKGHHMTKTTLELFTRQFEVRVMWQHWILNRLDVITIIK